MHLLPLLLCFGLYALFAIVGSAATRTLYARGSRIQAFLFSPAIGCGLVLFPVFLLNRVVGTPVGQIGPIVVALVFIAAITVHTLCHLRRVPDAFFSAEETAGAAADIENPRRLVALNYLGLFRSLLPFLVILGLAGLFIGRPMLTHGFNWVSFCNDDMANYSLAADRVLRGGYTEPPTVEALRTGTDYAQIFYFMHVPNMARAGAETLLAVVVSCTGLYSAQAFMPLILVFHLCVIGAAAGLVMMRDDRRWIGLMTAALAAANAEMAFGTLYQLLAQTAGLSLLCVNLGLIARDFDGLLKGQRIRHGVLVGIATTSQLLIYPEVNAFLAAGYFFYFVVGVVRRRIKASQNLAVLGIGACTTLCMLTVYVYDTLVHMFYQREAAVASDDPSLTYFPFFMLPSGIPVFFGLIPIAQVVHYIELNLAIGFGLVLAVLLIVLMFRLTWRGEPAAGVLLFCFLLGAVLFKANSGFGLYKLGMYAQPFAVGVLGVWCGSFKNRKARNAALVLVLVPLALLNLRLQRSYVEFSEDRGGATFSEVLGATRSGLLQEVRREMKALPAPDAGGPQHLLVDTNNIVLAKFIASFTAGRQTAFPGTRLSGNAADPLKAGPLARQEPRETTQRLRDALAPTFNLEHFRFDPDHPTGENIGRFWYYRQGGRTLGRPDGDEAWLIAGTKAVSVFNGRKLPNAVGNLVVTPLAKVKNHLIFTETDRSKAYYLSADPNLVSVYQIEIDRVYFPMDRMAGIGRYLMFELLKPEEQVRLVVNMTASLKSDGENLLPPASAVGVEKSRMGFAGRGAARIFSSPIKPVSIPNTDRRYVGLDMGTWGNQFPTERTGLMGLFGNRVLMDRRRLVGFARDISAISEAEFNALRPPAGITNWAPSDRCELRHMDLEYSGIYEDGWISEKSFVTLGQESDRPRLIIRGNIDPMNDPAFKSNLTLKVDGKQVSYQLYRDGMTLPAGPLGAGNFEIEAAIPPTGIFRRRIDMEWSAFQKLPGSDQRPVAAKLTSITLEPNPPGVK